MNILMPQLGETVNEGTITRWNKAVGDAVAAGDPLFDIETDKTTMEVPAIAAGTLREIRAAAGETVSVGSIVAVLAERGAAEATAATAATKSAPTPALIDPARPHAAPIDPLHGLRTPAQNFGKSNRADGVQVTPLARRLAAEARMNVANLQGSGPQGRIVAADVRRVVSQGVAPATVPAAESDPVRAAYRNTPHRELPLDGMRKQIARRLSESKQHVPHFYVSADIRAESLLTLRHQLNEGGEARVSVNDLLVKAYALALRKVPAANVVWAGDALLQLEQVDIGVAVAVPGGLMTPIVRKADTAGLSQLSADLAALIGRARQRKLQPAEYNGGSATVSNLGMYGVRSFQAIVNPPQATILAVGAAERRVIEAPDGSLRATSILSVCLSVDHRAVEGATAAELLTAFRTITENPCAFFFDASPKVAHT